MGSEGWFLRNSWNNKTIIMPWLIIHGVVGCLFRSLTLNKNPTFGMGGELLQVDCSACLSAEASTTQTPWGI